LNRLVTAVHPAAEEARADGDQGHRNQNPAGQGRVDVGHEPNGGGAHDHGVVQGHQPHAGGHADLLNVVGGVGHQISGPRAVEIFGGKRLKVAEETVAKAFLHAPGSPQQAQAPDVAKNSHQNGDGSDADGVKSQASGWDGHGREVVHSRLDDPRDDELQNVDHD
jgi:hypothetical protein